eukprot:763842-Hanusia_phi.AAC.7
MNFAVTLPQGKQGDRAEEQNDGQEALLKKFIVTLMERGFFAGLTEGTVDALKLLPPFRCVIVDAPA